MDTHKNKIMETADIWHIKRRDKTHPQGFCLAYISLSEAIAAGRLSVLALTAFSLFAPSLYVVVCKRVTRPRSCLVVVLFSRSRSRSAPPTAPPSPAWSTWPCSSRASASVAAARSRAAPRTSEGTARPTTATCLAPVSDRSKRWLPCGPDFFGILLCPLKRCNIFTQGTFFFVLHVPSSTALTLALALFLLNDPGMAWPRPSLRFPRPRPRPRLSCFCER